MSVMGSLRTIPDRAVERVRAAEGEFLLPEDGLEERKAHALRLVYRDGGGIRKLIAAMSGGRRGGRAAKRRSCSRG